MQYSFSDAKLSIIFNLFAIIQKKLCNFAPSKQIVADICHAYRADAVVFYGFRAIRPKNV